MGEIKFAGMSVNDAEGLVAKRFAERGVFKDPQVTIVEKEYMAQNVTVIGEVQKPGIYPVTGKRTLFDVISAAGGPSTKTGHPRSLTHRGAPHAPEPIHLTSPAP